MDSLSPNALGQVVPLDFVKYRVIFWIVAQQFQEERDGGKENADPRTKIWTELRNWTSRNVKYDCMTVKKYIHTKEDLEGPFKEVLLKVDALK